MIVKRYFSETTFADLPTGAIYHRVFTEEIEEKFFIKTDKYKEWEGYLAVNLETGEYYFPSLGEKVAPVECELHVKT